MEYQSSVCDECGYVHLCMPEVIGKEVDICNDPETIAMVERWQEIKPLHAEYDKLDKELKPKLEGKEKLLIGGYYIDGKWIPHTKYEYPDEIKEKYAKADKQWRRKVTKI